MWHIRVSARFSAAHQIRDHGGRCEQVHGHNYRVEVTISSDVLSPPGMIADFAVVRSRLAAILPDHRMLNEVYDFNPTAENLARHFYEEMRRHFPVTSVTVWENDDSAAGYSAG